MTVDSGPLMMILRLSPDLVAFLSFYVASFSCRFSSHEYLAATGPHPPRKTTEGGQKTHPGCLGQRPAQETVPTTRWAMPLTANPQQKGEPHLCQATGLEGKEVHQGVVGCCYQKPLMLGS